jgi:hypothetical protein
MSDIHSNLKNLADTVKLAAEPASGQRPEFTGDPLVERLFGITLALTTELAVTRERLDTIERLLDQHDLLPREAIETFQPDAVTGVARAQGHQEYLARIFRVLLQDAGRAAPTALSLAPAPAATAVAATSTDRQVA